jgi:hypothetical protein
VKSAERAGVQTGHVVKAEVNIAPSDASWSMFSVPKA